MLTYFTSKIGFHKVVQVKFTSLVTIYECLLVWLGNWVIAKQILNCNFSEWIILNREEIYDLMMFPSGRDFSKFSGTCYIFGKKHFPVKEQLTFSTWLLGRSNFFGFLATF